MTSSPSEHPYSSDPLSHFLRDLPRTVRELERAIDRLLESSWEEPYRKRALEMAQALADASAASSLSHLSSLTRAIASLLSLRLEDIFSIQEALREKLRELLAMLKELSEETGESAQA